MPKIGDKIHTLNYTKVIASLLMLVMTLSNCAFAYTLPSQAPIGSEEASAFDQKINNILLTEEKLLIQKKNGYQLAALEAKNDTAAIERFKTDIIKFRVSEIRFSGNETLPAEDLKTVVDHFLGKEINFKVVDNIVSAVKEHYRSQGYMATYAYVPPQSLKEGILEVTVVEGRLGSFEIVGNKWFSSALLKRQFSIHPNEIIKYEHFRGDLERLNQHRDIDARIVLKPGATPGTSDVQLEVKDQHPYHLNADMNNLGTRDTGRYRYGTTFSHTNVTGNMDDLAVRYQFGRDAWAVAGDYSVPVNYHGTRVGGTVTHAKNQVGGDFSILDIEGDATTYGAYATHPILKRENFQTDLRVGIERKDIENRILGFVSGKDEIDDVNMGLQMEGKDKLGKTNSSHMFYLGKNGDEGDDLVTGTRTAGSFYVYRGSLTRQQKLSDKVFGVLKISGQLSPDDLPVSEQIRLGGAYTVRGYEEGEYLGDYGVYTNIELHVPGDFLLPVFPRDWKLPFSKKPLNEQIKWVAFADLGVAGVQEPIPGEAARRYMIGAGFGLRVHLYDNVYARLDWASPLDDRRPDKLAEIVYFGISAELF